MLKWGIIGPGNIAHQFAQALAASEKGRLHAVASRRVETAKAFAEQYGAAAIYSDYDALLADPEVNLVYIATPHSHHYPWAKKCLKAGKHLLMEKPLTVNAKQTAELIALSEQNNVLFQEALWSRFMPCFEQVKRWLADDEIGPLEYITSQIGFAFAHLRDHRLTDPALAGGALLDLGVYSVSLTQHLVGEYTEQIQAMGRINNDGVDQNVLVNMRYPSGVFGQFTTTIGAQCSNVMTLHGVGGKIELDAEFWVGRKARLVKANGTVNEIDFPHPVNGFEFQIEESMHCVENGLLCSEKMPHADSLNVMETLDEIRSQIGLKYPAEIESLD